MGFGGSRQTRRHRSSPPTATSSRTAGSSTGEGATNPEVEDGAVIGTTLPRPRAPVTVTIGGVNAEVAYAGGAPGLVAGVIQINAKVPLGLAPGNHPVVMKVGGLPSQPGLTVAVK